MKKLIFLLMFLFIYEQAYTEPPGGSFPRRVTTDYSHHECHGEDCYAASYVEDGVNSGSKVMLLVNSPSGQASLRNHMIIEFGSKGEAYCEIWKGTAYTDGTGSALTVDNADMESVKSSGVSVINGPTIVSAGTQESGHKLVHGSGKNSGGESRNLNELLFPKGNALINCVSEANGNEIQLRLNFYMSNDYY